jgi:predicted DNA-binding protein (MmcQ/YjbR family)
MNIEMLRDYCLSKKGVTESLPFDNNTLVFKVMGKMFLAADIEGFSGFNGKCDPEKAIELREKYPSVKPGYHMNKVHWNTYEIPSDLSVKELYYCIDHSYQLVVNSLPRKLKEELENLAD